MYKRADNRKIAGMEKFSVDAYRLYDRFVCDINTVKSRR